MACPVKFMPYLEECLFMEIDITCSKNIITQNKEGLSTIRLGVLCMLEVLLPVFCWGDAKMLLEGILEIGLVGKMQIVADLRQGHIGIAEQILCLPHPTFGNIFAYILSGLCLEFCSGIGPAFTNMGSYLRDSDSFRQMGGNVLHTREYLFGNTFWELCLRHPACKVDEHIELEIFDCINAL